jgi:hypothetical protein
MVRRCTLAHMEGRGVRSGGELQGIWKGGEYGQEVNFRAYGREGSMVRR